MKFYTEYLTFNTKKHREYINITPQVETALRKSGIQDGMILVSAMHITAGVWVNDAEDGLLADIDAWLEKLAERTSAKQGCLEVVGHTSATGLPAINDRLSGLRADYIKDRLEDEQKSLRGRLIATGKGSREMLVGTGKDDPSDALDRRVEFKVAPCGGSSGGRST